MGRSLNSVERVGNSLEKALFKLGRRQTIVFSEYLNKQQREFERIGVTPQRRSRANVHLYFYTLLSSTQLKHGDWLYINNKVAGSGRREAGVLEGICRRLGRLSWNAILQIAIQTYNILCKSESGIENVLREQLLDCCGYSCLRALNRVWTLIESA